MRKKSAAITIIIIIMIGILAFYLGRRYENRAIKTHNINRYQDILIGDLFYLHQGLEIWYEGDTKSMNQEIINRYLNQIITIMTMDLDCGDEVFYPELRNPIEPQGELLQFFYNIYNFMNEDFYGLDTTRKEYYNADGVFTQEEHDYIYEAIQKLGEISNNMNEIQDKILTGKYASIEEFRAALWVPISN